LASIDLTVAGNYILAGRDIFSLHLVQIDDDGTPNWDKTYNWSNFLVSSSANAVKTTRDSGYVTFGGASPPERAGIYIVKTNNAGDLW